MPYRVRVFCTGSDVPALAQVFEYANAQSANMSPDETHGATGVDSSDWSEVEISYNTDKSPLVVECNRDDGTNDCLARAEVKEYLDKIGSPGFSRAKRFVIKHLKATKFIIASQLLSDIEDDGYNANSSFLKYFVEHCGGMIHADGEGFYDGDKVILEVG